MRVQVSHVTTVVASVQRGRLKMQDWKLADQFAGLENAGLENVGPENAGMENAGPENAL